MDVVKVGGSAGLDLEAIADDVASLWREGRRMVLVHGGSDETNRLAERLGQTPRFVTSESGYVSRFTDRPMLEVFLMATALINRRWVEALQGRGVNALGLSGLDGRLVEGRRKDVLRVVEAGRARVLRGDWTGIPERVDRRLLGFLIESGYLPVIAPVAVSPKGEALNVDGDRLAAAVAGTFQAATLVILTNVPGILRRYPDEASLIGRVTRSELDELRSLVQGGMRKKLLAAAAALDAGVGRVVIADGRRSLPLRTALAGEGTIIEE
ncbi:MAG: [LysW]-aminoadipate kinase [Acidobacteria bacterium]|nr:[LysW]-aminoadipate kinase [Acidobacteriota bacterium]MDW7984340.1 [LysW]-aminoadipate kinase [Acidobacteriota bacterium]